MERKYSPLWSKGHTKNSMKLSRIDFIGCPKHHSDIEEIKKLIDRKK